MYLKYIKKLNFNKKIKNFKNTNPHFQTHIIFKSGAMVHPGQDPDSKLK